MLQLRRSYVTITLIAVNVLWFIVETHNGFSTTGLLRSGAMDYTDVVGNGQWWRIISSMFVHGGFLHIAGNMVSLAVLGVVEQFVGRLRYLIIYFVSGICGNLAELVIGSHNAVVMGASGAIMGVFGIAFAMSFHKNLPASARNQLIAWFAFNLIIGFTTTGIANTAHIAGVLTGFVATELMVYRASRVVWTFLIGITTLVCTLGMAATVATAGVSDTQDSVSHLIAEQNQTVAIQQETVNAFNGLSNGTVSAAKALQGFKTASQSLTIVMSETKGFERQAPKQTRPVFSDLYQSEAYWQQALKLLVNSEGKLDQATYQQCSALFKKSTQMDNEMYKLAQPLGVQRVTGK